MIFIFHSSDSQSLFSFSDLLMHCPHVLRSRDLSNYLLSFQYLFIHSFFIHLFTCSFFVDLTNSNNMKESLCYVIDLTLLQHCERADVLS